ncbi:MAG: DUF2017 family protein [Actinomycetota bacterium]
MAEVSSVRGGVRLRLADYEVELLDGLADEMRILLEADVPSIDPVKARLFPRAYEDPEEQAAYERLTGNDLLTTKSSALRQVKVSLDEARGGVVLTDDALDAWLTFLTDIRLAIGTRLNVNEEVMAAAPDPDDPDAPALSALHWLGMIQELILEELGGTA